jgi:4-hydroxybenzoate polyprenyltransferase
MVFFWTIYLNTAYSYQDVVDDRNSNVNSFYNALGDHIRLLLSLLVAPILVCLPVYLSSFHSMWLWVSWMGVLDGDFGEPGGAV